MDEFGFLALVTATFVLAGLVKGIIGLGLPTVSIGLLGLAMTPSQAAVLLVVPTLVTNVWQLALGPNFLGLCRRLWPMFVGLTVGTLAGGWVLPVDDSGWASVVLGSVLVLYAGAGLFLPRFQVPPRAEPWLAPLVGLLTGLMTAVTAVFAVPMVPYLQALGLKRDDLVQALGLSFTVATVALAAVLTRNGEMHLSVAGSSILALGAALVGMYVGQKMRERINPDTFRICFFLGMLMLGAHLASRGFL